MEPVKIHQQNIVNNYHGTPVADPYRWLEDADSPETRSWVALNNELSQTHFQNIQERSRLIARLTELTNYPRYSTPLRKGAHYFFSRNTGLQNQMVLLKQETLTGEPSVVLDPNQLSEDGTVALTTSVFSHDGSYMAYGLSTSGSDWQAIKIRRLDDGEDYPETLNWCKFTAIAWKHDNSGFYYNRFPETGSVPEEDQSYYNRIYWHQLGTPQTEDRLIYERPDAKELSFSPLVTDDGKYLLLSVWLGTDPKNRLYYREVESEGPFIHLLDDFDAAYEFISNSGPLFYMQTDRDAPRGRIIAIDTEHPEPENWREIIPEAEAESRDAIAFTTVVNQRLIVTYKHNAHHVLKTYTLDGAFIETIPLPMPGSITELEGRPEGTELFLNFTSFLYPPSVFRYDFQSGSLELWQGPDLHFALEEYQTTQVFYASADGTGISMFLTHKKDLVLDGNNPTLLYGYGGFSQSLTPTFASHLLLWLESGGIYAVPNLRGGNEYGEEWHLAGMLEKKQNVFDDFIAAAEWLIEQKYTCQARLAINGASNGGLLVAACMVQRPELYGAVVCEVPVIDMLRYHKFTVGCYWIPEYGNAEAEPEHFKFLYAYSPLHNLRPGVAYPATLIMAAEADDRVVPAHSKKFAATLLEVTGGKGTTLLRIETRAGHGLGKPTAKVIEARGDVYAFLFGQFDMHLADR